MGQPFAVSIVNRCVRRQEGDGASFSPFRRGAAEAEAIGPKTMASERCSRAQKRRNLVRPPRMLRQCDGDQPVHGGYRYHAGGIKLTERLPIAQGDR